MTVCKKAFVNIHAITPARVRRLCQLLVEGKQPNDKRGQCISGNAVPGNIVMQIEDHIRSFPTKISRYSGTEKHYLDEKLNVKLMFELFKIKYPATKVKYKFYLKIFKERFSLGFGRPQVDTCCKCEELNIKIKSPSLNDAAKRAACAELMVHKRRAQKFYNKLKTLTELCANSSNTDTAVITFDYMQNLQLPVVPVQETFYLRQLTVNIFGINYVGKQEATFYVYHEGIARKGPNEVASFIMDFINDNIPGSVKHLHIFSDSCGGQNRNHTIVRFLMALVQTGRFETINQYFPQRGHSFLPNDRNFAAIKRVVRRYDRVYSLKQYVEMIVNSNRQSKFFVKLVKSEDIVNFKSWWPAFYKRNTLSVDSFGRGVPRDKKESFQITNFTHFRYVCDEPGVVQAYHFIDGFTSLKFRLATSNNVTLPESSQNPAYEEGSVPINSKKLDHIKQLMSYVTEEFHEFYNAILLWPTTENTEEDV